MAYAIYKLNYWHMQIIIRDIPDYKQSVMLRFKLTIFDFLLFYVLQENKILLIFQAPFMTKYKKINIKKEDHDVMTLLIIELSINA